MRGAGMLGLAILGLAVGVRGTALPTLDCPSLEVQIDCVAQGCAWDGQNCQHPQLPQTPKPTKLPTAKPTKRPTLSPTKKPTTQFPTKRPTTSPTKRPTKPTTSQPTKRPQLPTQQPTRFPTRPTSQRPTKRPTVVTNSPSKRPTTRAPTKKPVVKPTVKPTTMKPNSKPATLPPTLTFPLVQIGNNLSTTPRAAMGHSVALDDTYLVVGASWDNARNGSVLLYFKNGTLAQKLSTRNVDERNRAMVGFGTAVAILDNVVAVGAPYDRIDFGAVFIFHRQPNGSFVETQKLIFADVWETPLTYSENLVGYSLSISPSRLLVGAPGYNYARGVGVVFKYNGTAYEYESRLDANDDKDFSQMGLSVSINDLGTVAVLGGPGDNAYRGAVWIFTRNLLDNTWSQLQPKLTAPSQLTVSKLGSSVSLNGAGNRVLVGGPTNNSNKGGTWVFEPNARGVWIQAAYLFPTITATFVPMQGTSVALNKQGDVAVTGGPRDNSDLGAANVFFYRNNQWIEANKLVPKVPPGYDLKVFIPQMGFSVAIHGYEMLLGAPYYYKLLGTAWYYNGIVN
ncbi:hypothetical protein BASA81_006840 [Batrachochytrium salamandrivorans]|nr:hypothetical protein BASA81_006840 [Batrachochytrium salamandrivorans]